MWKRLGNYILCLTKNTISIGSEHKLSLFCSCVQTTWFNIVWVAAGQVEWSIMSKRVYECHWVRHVSWSKHRELKLSLSESHKGELLDQYFFCCQNKEHLEDETEIPAPINVLQWLRCYDKSYNDSPVIYCSAWILDKFHYLPANERPTWWWNQSRKFMNMGWELIMYLTCQKAISLSPSL